MENKERLGLLIFLQTRNELTPEEVLELKTWRQQSSANEKLFQQLADSRQTQEMLADLYKTRNRVFDKLKAKFPYLADVNLNALNYSNEELSEGLAETHSAAGSVTAWWGSVLPDGLPRSENKMKTTHAPAVPIVPMERMIVRLYKYKAVRWTTRIVACFLGLYFILYLITLFSPPTRAGKYTGALNASFITMDGVEHDMHSFMDGYHIGAAGFDRGTDKEGFLIYDAHDFKNAAPDKKMSLIIPRASEFPFRFPNQTSLWINSESRLDFPAHFRTDTITMNFRGETYMEVPAHTKTVIQLKLPNGYIEIMGGNINIQSYPDDPFATITVLTGGAIYRNDAVNNHGSDAIILHTGQQLRITGSEAVLIPNANAAKAVNWRNDRISFDNEDLETIMRYLSRLYNMQIQYPLPARNEKYSIDLQRDIPLSEFLAALEKQGPRFDVKGKTIRVR